MRLSKLVFLGGVVMSVMLVAGCRKQPSEAEPTSDQVIQEETNKFLTEQGIELPEGAQKAYLSGDLGNRGVATRETGNNTNVYTVVASLPELKVGVYQGFISDGMTYKSLGILREDKGGFVGEKTLSATGLENFNQVIVSQGVATASPSAEVVLAGQFAQ